MSEIKNYSESLKDDIEISKNIFITQIQQIHKMIPITIIGPVLGAFITAVLLKDDIPPTRTLIWLILVVISYGLFIRSWSDFKKYGVTSQNVKRLARQYIIFSWLAVSCWGSVSFFMFASDNFNAQVLLAMSAMIGISAIMSSTILYSPVFYTILAMSIPMIAIFIIEGSRIHYIIALGCAIYTLMLFFLHASMHKSMVRSIRLQFVNELLATDLNIQKDRADKANLDKSKFLAAVSHDLRQPLHAHSLFFGELQNRLIDKSAYKDLLIKLETSIESINELFNALLDLSKLEAGAINTDIQTFFMNDLFHPIEQEYKVKCKSAGLKFNIVKTKCIVRSDKILLSRIIRNLLENALKHSTKGTILFGCRRKGKNISIQILDNGKGISKHEQKYIFDEYYQIDKKKHSINIGFGLGLSVVKEYCDLLGHPINLFSEKNKGTVFSIEVPLSSKQLIIENKISFDNFGECDLEGLNVVVLDNDLSIQDAMTGILSSWGCQPIVGASANDILPIISKGFVPDIILSDYYLDNFETGIDAIDQLRSVVGKYINAAIITGDTSKLDIKEMNEKNYPLLQKPVNLSKLRTLLRFLKD